MTGTSWKTTVAAVLAVLPQVLVLVFPKFITTEVATALSILFGAIGLGVAKDSNVTGGTIVNATNDAKAVSASAGTSVAEGVAVQPSTNPVQPITGIPSQSL